MSVAMYDFYTQLAQAINSGQSRSILLYGNVGDLFIVNDKKEGDKYVPLVPFLNQKWSSTSYIQVIVELNGPLKFVGLEENKNFLCDAWVFWKREQNPGAAKESCVAEFNGNIVKSAGQPAFALEFLRQLCMACREYRRRIYCKASYLLVLIESAEMVIPSGSGDISQLQQLDRRKVAILEDWFSDPEFYEGKDSVILISQSKSQIHPRITKMPQLAQIEVKSPNVGQRQCFIEWQWSQLNANNKLNFETVAQQTAGLSLLALRQLLIESNYRHSDQAIPPDLIIAKVEEYMQSQLGEDVVEFKRPSHNLHNVIGFSELKKFIREKLIPRIQNGGKGALSAIGVAGAIGCGKTYIFEAMANEMNMPIIVLKSIRSKWFGETDAIFETLRRVLEAIGKCLIFIDEADTQFGGVGSDTHETERRLTGKVQAMMSDPKLKGQVVWLLMTARIHQLSPDMRRQGRAGDLIIPVLDPVAEDLTDYDSDFYQFVRWVVEAAIPGFNEGDFTQAKQDDLQAIGQKMQGRSAASFAMIRSLAISEDVKDRSELEDLIDDVLEPDIKQVRRFQELQALLNCTRLSLLPKPSKEDENLSLEERRSAWRSELKLLEAEGVGA